MPSMKLPSSRKQTQPRSLNQSNAPWEPRLTWFHKPLPYGQPCLRHRGNGVVRRAHLGENFIQPLQWTVKMNLNPAWSARHILTMVLCAPTLENNTFYIKTLFHFSFLQKPKYLETVDPLYHTFTKLMRMVHIFVSS